MSDDRRVELTLSDADRLTLRTANVPAAHRCPYAETCGACQLLGWDDATQAQWKQAQLVDVFKPLRVSPQAFLAAPQPLGYRRKNTYVFKAVKRDIIAGFYAGGSKRLLDIKHCLIQDPRADALFKTLKRLMKEQRIVPYDPQTGEGTLKNVVIRTTTIGIMVILVNAQTQFPGRKNLIQALRQVHPEITSIIENTHPKDSPYVLSNRNTVIYGPDHLIETLGPWRFKVGPSSFFQVYPDQALRLFEDGLAHAELKSTDQVADLYCGVGVFGLLAAKHVKQVIGIESNPTALSFAKDNAALNQCTNVSFQRGDATEALQQLERIDVVLMDPPREGATKAFIEGLMALNPRTIVYVSCNPITQVRDLLQLSRQYTITHVRGADLFPQTTHVESVAVLQRSVTWNRR
jgi:23S rRNA (uracil1939-C5)-methyltransferase